MFEMTEERPSYWGPFDNHSDLFSPGERKNHTAVIVPYNKKLNSNTRYSVKNETVLLYSGKGFEYSYALSTYVEVLAGSHQI